jgi:hypothetical protein
MAGQSGVEPLGVKGFSLLPPFPTGPEAHPASSTMGHATHCQGQSGRNVALATHPASGSEVAKEYSYICIPPLRQSRLVMGLP